MRRQLISIMIIILTFFSCKKDNKDEISVRLKSTTLTVNGQGAFTCSITYSNNTIELDIHTPDQHSSSQLTYDENNKLNKIESTFYPIGSDPPYVEYIANFTYYSSKIIELDRNSDKEALTGKDSLVYNLDNNSKIISWQQYNWQDWNNSYGLRYDETDIWGNNNISSASYNKGDVGSSITNYTYDLTKKNPIFPIIQGIPQFDDMAVDLFGIISISENFCTNRSEKYTSHPSEQITEWTNIEYGNLKFNNYGYPTNADVLVSSSEGNTTGQFTFDYETY